jgi:hypothetical protein
VALVYILSKVSTVAVSTLGKGDPEAAEVALASSYSVSSKLKYKLAAIF